MKGFYRNKRMRKIFFTCVLCLSLAFSGSLWAASSNGVVSEVVAKGAASWDGAPLPAYGTGKPEITILRITIPPQAVLDMHEHTVINAGVLVSGELTVITVEGKTLRLKAGDGIIEVVNTAHYGKNESQVPAQIIVFYAGIVDKPLTLNK
jgi:quercetin dioxygenase-like cupin family protein